MKHTKIYNEKTIDGTTTIKYFDSETMNEELCVTRECINKEGQFKEEINASCNHAYPECGVNCPACLKEDCEYYEECLETQKEKETELAKHLAELYLQKMLEEETDSAYDTSVEEACSCGDWSVNEDCHNGDWSVNEDCHNGDWSVNEDCHKGNCIEDDETDSAYATSEDDETDSAYAEEEVEEVNSGKIPLFLTKEELDVLTLTLMIRDTIPMSILIEYAVGLCRDNKLPALTAKNCIDESRVNRGIRWLNSRQ